MFIMQFLGLVSPENDDVKFNPENLELSPRKILEKTHCHICYKFHELKLGRFREYVEPGLDMLFCQGCKATVHHYCYGIKTPIKQELKVEKSKYRLKVFTCDSCQDQGPKECAICFQEKGLLKKISAKKYVHVICALFSEEYQVQDFEEMKIGINHDYIMQECQTLCKYCKKPNAMFKCHEKACGETCPFYCPCDEACHIYCACEYKLPFLIKNEECTDGFRFLPRKTGNVYKTSLASLRKKVKKEIKGVYDKLSAFLDEGDSGNREDKLNKIPDNPKERSQEEGGRNRSQSINNERNKSKENKNAVSKLKSKDKFKTISDKVKKEIKNFEEFFSQYQDPDMSINNFIEVECQEHRKPEILCTCKTPYDRSKTMFACDFCENWFHYQCFGVTEEEVKTWKNYFCKRCHHWSTLRHNFFHAQTRVELPAGEYIMKDQNGIIPEDTWGFWILDYIVISIMFQRKCKVLDTLTLENKLEFKQSFKKLLESADYIPFRLNFINSLLENFFKGFCAEQLLLRLFPSKYKGKHSFFGKKSFNVYKINSLRKKLECLQKATAIYQEKGLLNASTEAIISSLSQVHQWKLDFYVSLENPFEKLSSLDIQVLEEKAQNLGIDPNTQERKYLNELKDKEEAWIKSIKDIIPSKKFSKNSKTNEILNISNEEFATMTEANEALEQVIQELKEEIDNKPNLERLEEVLKEGESLKVGLGENLEILKRERARIQNIRENLKIKSKNLGEIYKKMVEVEEAAVRFPEAIEEVEHYKRVVGIKLKLQYYARLCLEEIIVDKDGLHIREETEEIDLKELEELLAEVRTIDIDFGRDQEIITEKVEEVKGLKQKITELNNSFVGFEELEALHKEIMKSRIRFPEAKFIKEKIVVAKKPNPFFNDIDQYFSENADVFDADLSESSLKSPMGDTNSEDQKAQEHFNKEEERKHSIELANNWLKSLRKFYDTYGNQNTESQEHEGQSNYGNSGGDWNQGSMMIDSETLDQWPLHNEKTIKAIERHLDSFREIVFAGISINFVDPNVHDMFINHAQAYWNLEIERIFSGVVELNEETLEQIEDLVRVLENEGTNINQKTYIEIFVEYYSWISQYKSILESREYKRLISHVDIKEDKENELKKSVLDLLESSKQLKMEVKEEEKVLTQALSLLIWIEKTREVIKTIENGSIVDFEILKRLCIEASLAKFPGNGSLYKKISEIFKEYNLLKESYDRYKSTRTYVAKSLAQIGMKRSTKEDIQKELFELGKRKVLLHEAQRLQKALEEKKYGLASKEELKEIGKDIKAGLELKGKVQALIEMYPLEDNEDLNEGEVEGIGQVLNSVMTEMLRLMLRDEEAEALIYGFEWRFHAKLLINKKERVRKGNQIIPGTGINVWKKLLKIANKRPNLELEKTQLYRVIQKQVQAYEELVIKVSALREQENFLGNAVQEPNLDMKRARTGLQEESEIKLLHSRLEKCSIDCLESKKYIEELLEKINNVKSSFSGLLSELENIKDIERENDLREDLKARTKSLLTEMYVLPLRFNQEERKLEEFGKLEYSEGKKKVHERYGNYFKSERPKKKVQQGDPEGSLLGKRKEVFEDNEEQEVIILGSNKPEEKETFETLGKKLKTYSGNTISKGNGLEEELVKIRKGVIFQIVKALTDPLEIDGKIINKTRKKGAKIEENIFARAGGDMRKYKEKVKEFLAMCSQANDCDLSNADETSNDSVNDLYERFKIVVPLRDNIKKANLQSCFGPEALKRSSSVISDSLSNSLIGLDKAVITDLHKQRSEPIIIISPDETPRHEPEGLDQVQDIKSNDNKNFKVISEVPVETESMKKDQEVGKPDQRPKLNQHSVGRSPILDLNSVCHMQLNNIYNSLPNLASKFQGIVQSYLSSLSPTDYFLFSSLVPQSSLFLRQEQKITENTQGSFQNKDEDKKTIKVSGNKDVSEDIK